MICHPYSPVWHLTRIIVTSVCYRVRSGCSVHCPAVTPSPGMDSEKQKSGKELEMAEANNNEGEKEEEVTVNKSFYLKLLEKSQMWQELQVT